MGIKGSTAATERTLLSEVDAYFRVSSIEKPAFPKKNGKKRKTNKSNHIFTQNPY